VLRLASVDRLGIALLLARYGLDLALSAPQEVIPGSYWGESEAGLKGNHLYARLDSPVHSILHEASHFICMTPERRSGLDRDAGGDDQEESAVCYLQVLLADEPTGNLDSLRANEVLELLKQLQTQGKTIVLISHDHELASRFADRCVRLKDGKVVEAA